ncbi:hypothetical protein MITS9509_03177 [Synechococcus sp. MIT S9509]|nr:hypothetical protein MITS9504_03083 [Synechococcus sp. MIT S9504]KZR88851.1 hypothetical protein MITS9509_03177 [Synechococcus sp. MIT S9509]
MWLVHLLHKLRYIQWTVTSVAFLDLILKYEADNDFIPTIRLTT